MNSRWGQSNCEQIHLQIDHIFKLVTTKYLYLPLRWALCLCRDVWFNPWSDRWFDLITLQRKWYNFWFGPWNLQAVSINFLMVATVSVKYQSELCGMNKLKRDSLMELCIQYFSEYKCPAIHKKHTTSAMPWCQNFGVGRAALCWSGYRVSM